MQNNYSKEEESYAGFFVRLSAYVIDSIIVFCGLFIVRLFLLVLVSFTEGTILGGNLVFTYTLKDILLYVFHVLYFILFTYMCGTTPGKRVLNLRVISAKDDEKLGFMDVLYRETVGRFLCSVTIGVGYIMAGVDKEKRGLHDMLCDTRVIYAKRVKVYPIYLRTPAEMPIERPPVQSGSYQFVDEGSKDGENIEQ